MIRLALRVKLEDSELVLAELLDLAPSGVEEVELDDHTVEYAIYGPPGELPALPELRAAAAGRLVEVATSEVPDDWSERWRQFHTPVLIEPIVPSGIHARSPSLHVRAPWHAPSERPGAIEIVIDPAQAFGTGAHATTRLCLQVLLDLSLQEARGGVLDIGTGSGVLAIAAAKLGFSPVAALDSERESIEAVPANAAANGVDLDVTRLDLRRKALPPLEGTLVLANLLYPLLMELASRIPHPPARMVLSGLLACEADPVASAFNASLGLVESRRLEHAGWAALLLEPGSSSET